MRTKLVLFAAFVISLIVVDDAEARRRFGFRLFRRACVERQCVRCVTPEPLPAPEPAPEPPEPEPTPAPPEPEPTPPPLPPPVVEDEDDDGWWWWNSRSRRYYRMAPTPDK